VQCPGKTERDNIRAALLLLRAVEGFIRSAYQICCGAGVQRIDGDAA